MSNICQAQIHEVVERGGEESLCCGDNVGDISIRFMKAPSFWCVCLATKIVCRLQWETSFTFQNLVSKLIIIHVVSVLVKIFENLSRNQVLSRDLQLTRVF